MLFQPTSCLSRRPWGSMNSTWPKTSKNGCSVPCRITFLHRNSGIKWPFILQESVDYFSESQHGQNLRSVFRSRYWALINFSPVFDHNRFWLGTVDGSSATHDVSICCVMIDSFGTHAIICQFASFSQILTRRPDKWLNLSQSYPLEEKSYYNNL